MKNFKKFFYLYFLLFIISFMIEAAEIKCYSKYRKYQSRMHKIRGCGIQGTYTANDSSENGLLYPEDYMHIFPRVRQF